MSENKNKEIEIVSGNVSDLDISPVFEHLNVIKPKTKNSQDKKKKIIIPKVKNKKESKESN